MENQSENLKQELSAQELLSKEESLYSDENDHKNQGEGPKESKSNSKEPSSGGIDAMPPVEDEQDQNG
jgi:hypothetical protein